jgi:hypothetical protein
MGTLPVKRVPMHQHQRVIARYVHLEVTTEHGSIPAVARLDRVSLCGRS